MPNVGHLGSGRLTGLGLNTLTRVRTTDIEKRNFTLTSNGIFKELNRSVGGYPLLLTSCGPFLGPSKDLLNPRAPSKGRASIQRFASILKGFLLRGRIKLTESESITAPSFIGERRRLAGAAAASVGGRHNLR